MKRLLAYLFLVLGLGLVFSVNANSNITILERTSEKIILHVPYGTSGAATIARNHCNRFNKNFVMDKGTYQTVYKGKKGSLIFYICKGQIQTQTAKKEPSQTQEVETTIKSEDEEFDYVQYIINKRLAESEINVEYNN